MRSISIVVIFLAVLQANAQLIKWEISLTPNYTFIGDQREEKATTISSPTTGYYSNSLNYKLEENYQGRFGTQLSFLGSKQVAPRISIKTGIGLSLHRFKRANLVISNWLNNVTYLPVVPGVPTGDNHGLIIGSIALIRDSSGVPIKNPAYTGSIPQDDEKLGETNALYMQIPVLFSYALNKKFTLSTGTQFSTLMVASEFQRRTMFSYSTGQYSINENSWNNSADGFNKLLVFVSLEIIYSVTRHFNLQAAYQRSLSPIYDASKLFSGEAKYNSASLGLSYSIKPR